MPQIQLMFAALAVLAPTVVFNTIASQLILHFQVVRADFQMKIHGSPATASTIASGGAPSTAAFAPTQALVLYDVYVKVCLERTPKSQSHNGENSYELMNTF